MACIARGYGVLDKQRERVAVRSAVVGRRCERGSGSRSGARQCETVQREAGVFLTRRARRDGPQAEAPHSVTELLFVERIALVLVHTVEHLLHRAEGLAVELAIAVAHGVLQHAADVLDELELPPRDFRVLRRDLLPQLREVPLEVRVRALHLPHQNAPVAAAREQPAVVRVQAYALDGAFLVRVHLDDGFVLLPHRDLAVVACDSQTVPASQHVCAGGSDVDATDMCVFSYQDYHMARRGFGRARAQDLPRGQEAGMVHVLPHAHLAVGGILLGQARLACDYKGSQGMSRLSF